MYLHRNLVAVARVLEVILVIVIVFTLFGALFARNVSGCVPAQCAADIKALSLAGKAKEDTVVHEILRVWTHPTIKAPLLSLPPSVTSFLSDKCKDALNQMNSPQCTVNFPSGCAKPIWRCNYVSYAVGISITLLASIFFFRRKSQREASQFKFNPLHLVLALVLLWYSSPDFSVRGLLGLFNPPGIQVGEKKYCEYRQGSWSCEPRAIKFAYSCKLVPEFPQTLEIRDPRSILVTELAHSGAFIVACFVVAAMLAEYVPLVLSKLAPLPRIDGASLQRQADAARTLVLARQNSMIECYVCLGELQHAVELLPCGHVLCGGMTEDSQCCHNYVTAGLIENGCPGCRTQVQFIAPVFNRRRDGEGSLDQIAQSMPDSVKRFNIGHDYANRPFSEVAAIIVQYHVPVWLRNSVPWPAHAVIDCLTYWASGFAYLLLFCGFAIRFLMVAWNYTKSF